MLRQLQHELRIRTRGRGFYEITDQIAEWITENKFQLGVISPHLCHTSASLLIQENADPDVRRDLENFFSRLVRDGDPMFVHTAEGPDDMPAHIRAALTAVNLSIPVARGRMTLGTWQGIYVWEHRKAPHSRKVVLHFVGE